MIKAAVLGSPIAHSLSPVLHARGYELLGISASYEAIDLRPESALDFFAAALKEDWTGFSLTMPLKESIFDLSPQIEIDVDQDAMRMRSANTLIRSGQGFRALSTDRSAFLRLFSGIKKERVAIIGGGGTARAALGALDGTSAQIDFLLRSPERAELLKQVVSESALSFFDMSHSLEGYDLVISTVPSGASDQIAQNLTTKISFLCEVLYKPFPTQLLARCQALGSQTLNGMDLLVEQALDQIKLFSKVDFDFGPMRDELLKMGRSHLL